MKLKIKILVKGQNELPRIIEKGDWIDLSTAEEVTFKAPYANCLHKKKNTEIETIDRYRDVEFDFKIISLGVAMCLPDGFEAVVVPRSSLFKKTGLLQANSMGVIDNSYKGADDVWGFPAIATKAITIPQGTRVCQFRIQLSQKATLWQKLKWLFSDGIEIIPTANLDNETRGGFGSTDINNETDDKEINQ